MVNAHPYSPQSLQLPNYVPPSRTTVELMGQFFIFVAVILLVSYVLIRIKTSKLSRQLIFVWFVSCGFIHCVIEGYFIANFKTIASRTDLLADCWKEYSYSDSRYLSADTFVLVMESITAVVWGSLSFVTAALIYSNHPARHILAFLVSTGQLYGDLLYYFTSLVEGAPHCKEDPNSFYFWYYFVGFNAPWIVFPVIIMWSTARQITASVRASDKKEPVEVTLKTKKQH